MTLITAAKESPMQTIKANATVAIVPLEVQPEQTKPGWWKWPDAPESIECAEPMLLAALKRRLPFKHGDRVAVGAPGFLETLRAYAADEEPRPRHVTIKSVRVCRASEVTAGEIAAAYPDEGIVGFIRDIPGNPGPFVAIITTDQP